MNHLILCLDACRYDSYVAADTPNFDKIGRPKKVYSHAGFTSAAMIGMLTNQPFYNSGDKVFAEGFGSMAFQSVWLPTDAKTKGFKTILLTPNPWVRKLEWIFRPDWDVFECLKYDPIWAARPMIDDLIIEITGVEKYFAILWFMATHPPYSNGVINFGTFVQDNRPQILAVQSVDYEFGRLLPYLHDVSVTICSDHGELFGEGGGWFHGPSPTPKCAVFHEKLFEIPMVRGRIE